MNKKIALFVLGGLLVAVGLIYGFTGMLVPSIQERSGHIARWEGEIVQKRVKVKALMAEVDKLGKEPATGLADGTSPFERKLAEAEYATRDIAQTYDLIEYEQGRKKEMSIITGAFAAAGILAMLIGWRMRAKTA